MKTIFKILLGLLFVTSSFAQKGFPVKIDTTGNYSKRVSELNGSNVIKEGGRLSSNVAISLKERVKMEGVSLDGLFTLSPAAYPLDGTATPETNGVSITSSASVAGGSAVQMGPARAGYCLGLDAWASADMYATFTYGIANGGTKRIVGTGGLRIQPECLVAPKDFIGVSFAGLVRPTSPTGNKVVATSSIQGYKFSADMNWSAKKRIYFLGDSNTEATSISTNIYANGISMHDVWSWKIRKWYRDNGNDVRIIDKSIGGKNSSDFEIMRQKGLLNLPEAPDIIFYAHGTNNYDAAIYGSDITTFINWALTEWPNVKIVVLGPANKQGADAQMVLNRTAAQAAVSSINKSNSLFYIDLSLAFSISDNTMYSGTEAAGSGVHWGVLGHTAIANYVISRILAAKPSFSTL